ncbi:MAG: ACT domain-containing protein [Candidatus Ornithospirochaeta sp.]
MRESFITSVPDESGAFLKAVRVFSTLGLNIVRTSYNKSVDSHVIFLEAEGEKKDMEKARKALSEMGYLSLPGEDEVVLLEFLLPDKPGTLEKILEKIEENGINISYISSVSDGSSWQHYRMGLFVKKGNEINEFLEEAGKIYMVRRIDYGPLDRSYDNSIFYSGFVNELARLTGVGEEKKGSLMNSANLMMEILDNEGLSPEKTFSAIAGFTSLLSKARGDGFDARVSSFILRHGYKMTVIEPPCGSNTVLIENGSALLAVDSGYALYRNEMEELFDSIIPGWRRMEKTLFLTHADVDHGGLFPLFDKIVCSLRSKECLSLEWNGMDGFREQNRLHRPYIEMCKTLTHYSLPSPDKVEAVGSLPDFSSSPVEYSGEWKWQDMTFALYEGKGGHLKGESLLLAKEDNILFAGDVWVNVHDMTQRQKEYNTLAPVLMTSVDTDPECSKEERVALNAMLKPGMKLVPGHGAIKEY